MAHSQSSDTGLLSGGMALSAVRDSFIKLNPTTLWRNPVIFVTEIVAVIATILFFFLSVYLARPTRIGTPASAHASAPHQWSGRKIKAAS